MGNEPTFLPYQTRWIEDRSRLKVVVKSRRIGISWATAEDAVRTAASYGRKGSDVWYTAYTEDAGSEFMRDIVSWIEAWNAAVPLVDSKDILKQSVTFPSGYKIQILTSKPRNLRGKKGLVVIDEAAHHDELRELLVSAKATNIWGTGRIALISTHFGADSEFAKIISEVESGELEASVHRVTFDDAIREGFYKRICKMSGEEWSPEKEKAWRDEWIKFYGDDADEELLCIPSSGGGRYFPFGAVEACATVPADRIVRLTNKGLLDDPAGREVLVDGWCRGELRGVLRQIPRSDPCYLGLDFARSTDLSVLVVLGRLSSGKREVYAVVETRNVPHEAQRQICEYVAHHVTLGGGAFDATGNGSYLAEALHERYQSIEPIQITTQWYVDTMPPLRAAIENRQVAIPADDDSLDDLAQVRLHNGIPKLVPGRRATKTGARHGDFAIALAMAFRSSLDSALDRWNELMSEFF